MNSQSTFFTFIWLPEMAMLSKASKTFNFKSHNSLNLTLPIFAVLLRISLDANLCLNQTLQTFLLYVRRSCMTKSILASSLWGVTYAWSCSWCEGGTSFCMGLIFKQFWGFSFMIFDWLYLIKYLSSFFSVDHHLCLCTWLLMPLHLTKMRFSQPTHLLVYLYLETSTSLIGTG